MKNYSGDRHVVMNMTITRDNYVELEALVELSKKQGFQGVTCNICAGLTDAHVPMAVKRKDKQTIIRELKRVKKLHPNDFLLNKRMIKWFEYPDHRDSCFWGEEVLHLDLSWNRRRCFASNFDCSNCGCFMGAWGTPFGSLKHPIELMKRIFGL